VVNNGNFNYETGRYDPQAPGRTVVTDQNTLLRGSTAWYWTGGDQETPWTADRASWKVPGRNRLNAVRLAVRPSFKPLDQQIVDIDRFVDWAQEEGLYLVIDAHWVNVSGGAYDKAALTTFWNAVAPRYADRTHVIYEVANEPVAWTVDKYTDQVVRDMNELYALIRGHAPDTHIMVLGFPTPNPGMDVVAAKMTGVDWSNASVAFHGYHLDDSRPISQLKARFPAVNTEFDETSIDIMGRMDGFDQHVQVMERLGISWFHWTGHDDPDQENGVLKPLLQDAAAKGYLWEPDA
jgi:hypothetical protein